MYGLTPGKYSSFHFEVLERSESNVAIPIFNPVFILCVTSLEKAWPGLE